MTPAIHHASYLISAGIAAALLLLWLCRPRKSKTQSRQKEPSNSGLQQDSGTTEKPLYEQRQLGPGISMIVHRSASIPLPNFLGNKPGDYERLIRELFAKFWPESDSDWDRDNQIWIEWIKLKQPRREPRDLTEFLKGDAKPQFKARALTILLLPGLRYSPFFWNDNTSLDNYLSIDQLSIDELTETLRDFAVDLVLANTRLVLASDNEKLAGSLFAYNRWLLRILGTMPTKDPRTQTAFELFGLNDPQGFCNLDDSSGYNPLHQLFNAQIPEYWKLAADKKMRAIIISEQTGATVPRYEWEDALSRYIQIVGYGLYGDSLPYSKELLTSQVEFIVGLANPQGKYGFDTCLRRLMPLLAGQEYQELRHKVARYELLKPADASGLAFSVYSPETRQLAINLLEEFGKTDSALRDRLINLLAKADEHDRTLHLAQSSREQEVKSVLDKMK